MDEPFQVLLKLLLILAPLLLVTRAIDLSCSPTFSEHETCYIAQHNPVPVNNTNDLNFIVPESWKFSEVERATIIVTSKPIPFPTNVFNVFPNLKELELSIHLKAISNEIFEQADKLKKLEIIFNELEKIPSRVFAGAKNLNEINLYHNKINEIEDFAFDGLNQLKNLRINVNQLTKVRRFTFAGLSSLEYLQLANNQIDEIEEGALNLPKLESLDLSENQLKILSDTLFAQVPKLRTLAAPRNKIQRVSKALDTLHNLVILELDENPIDDLDLLKLSKLEDLDKVSLRNTGFDLDALSVTAEHIHASNSKITRLDLSGCKMQSGIIFSKLKIFPKLEILRVKNNSITAIDLDAIRNGGLPSLIIIFIGENSFRRRWLQETTKSLSMKYTYKDRFYDTYIVVKEYMPTDVYDIFTLK